MRSSVRAAAGAAVAVVVGSSLLTGAGAAGAATAPGSATVRLAGNVTPAAPDASTVATVTIPLAITNTGDEPLYDVAVSSLRSAPITTGSDLDAAFDGDAIERGSATKSGPTQELAAPIAPGATGTFAYTVDSSDDEATGICLCFLGVYALDLTVTAADEPGGDTATVARTQTYLPSLTGDREVPMTVGWLWPLLDRPHRLTAGDVFTDDDLAGSVAPGGRLDRALSVVEQVDAAEATVPGVSRSLLLLLDPEILDELVTMTGGYTVQAADGSTETGTGGDVARQWLARLAAVVPRHDVRTTLPGDPDVVGLAARGVAVPTAPDATVAAGIAAALGLAALPPHDLAWPVKADPDRTELDRSGLAALTGTGATAVVTTADTDDDGAVAAVTDDGGPAAAALLADPGLTAHADAAIGNGEANGPALQRLVTTAAMTSVAHPDDPRFVLVAPARDLDVSPAAAVAAVLGTSALGTPTSPVAALTAGDGDTRTSRSDLLTDAAPSRPAPLGAAIDAAVAAGRAVSAVRAAAVGDAGAVVGDLPGRVQLVASNSWVDHPDAAVRPTTDLAERSASLANAVQVVARTSGSYSLASADAPLLLTVANPLPVAVRIRVDVAAVGRTNGFRAASTDTVVVAADSRPTLRVPTAVSRSGRFDVAVTLRTADGAELGTPTRITVTSTAVGTVGQIVTYGAGALLVLALLVRGVRRLWSRSTAGSDGPGPDDDDRRDGTRPEGQSTVPATP